MEREREGWIGVWLEGVSRSGRGNGRGDSAKEFCGVCLLKDGGGGGGERKGVKFAKKYILVFDILN